MKINDLEFELTCSMFPEQYDVYKEDKQVGYVRLRWGCLSAEYPDVCGELIYEHQFEDLIGCFNDDTERMYYLTIISEAIIKKENEVHYEKRINKTE